MQLDVDNWIQQVGPHQHSCISGTMTIRQVLYEHNKAAVPCVKSMKSILPIVTSFLGFLQRHSVLS